MHETISNNQEDFKTLNLLKISSFFLLLHLDTFYSNVVFS